MSEFAELQDRLHHIDNQAAERPGEALDDLETVLKSLDDALIDRHERARALVRTKISLAPPTSSVRTH